MAVKERGRERGAISTKMLEERERGGGGWGIVRKKRGEDGRRWTGTKPLGGGGRESTPSRPRMKKRRNRRKETVKICPLSHYIFNLFTQIQTKKLLFARLRTPVHSHTR